jgi:uncharacterized iron-regulated protein
MFYRFAMRFAVVFVVVVGGCTGRYPAATPARPTEVDAAALPFAIVDGRTGGAVAESEFWAAVDAARVVCVGEEHDDPHAHWAQLAIVDRWAQRRGGGLSLGLEMVQRPFQAVLDDFAAGRIDEAAMLSRVGWGERWRYDYALYRPIVDVAVARGASLVALNAARELTKKVGRQGLDALTADERAQIARDLVLDDAEHRAWFDGVMSAFGGAEAHAGHPRGDAEPLPPGHPPVPAAPSADQIYTVQVIWDETMAETAARWLGDGGRAMVILAGNGHCHDSAIVRRAARRGAAPAISVRPIVDDGQGNVAAAIQERRNDYLFVMARGR